MTDEPVQQPVAAGPVDTARAADKDAAAALLGEGPSVDERAARLADGASELDAAARTSLLAHPRFLVVAAGTLMTIGTTVILLGWAGASRTTLVAEQIPYLISGGLLGVALAVIGGLMFFTHWITVAIREERERERVRRSDHAELMAAVGELTDALRATPKSRRRQPLRAGDS